MIPIRSIAVSGVLLSEINSQIKILLMKRVQGEFWSHVAGRIEQGECASQTILREIIEETGIQVENLYSADYLEQFYEASLNTIEFVPVFVVYCSKEQKVILNEEHSEYGWFSLEEAKEKAEFAGQRLLYDYIWKNFVQRQPSKLLKIKII